MTAPLDLTGQQFGRLTVIERIANDKRGSTRWLCDCQCGCQREVSGRGLKHGKTKSCGCLWRENSAVMYREIGKANRTHGHTPVGNHSVIYVTWSSMKQRCTNPRHGSFKNYGGRGIKICARWLNSFENVFADMGERPPERSLDRIDNDGNYEPSNCRWATIHQQNANKRRPVGAVL